MQLLFDHREPSSKKIQSSIKPSTNHIWTKRFLKANKLLQTIFRTKNISKICLFIKTIASEWFDLTILNCLFNHHKTFFSKFNGHATRPRRGAGVLQVPGRAQQVVGRAAGQQRSAGIRRESGPHGGRGFGSQTFREIWVVLTIFLMFFLQVG